MNKVETKVVLLKGYAPKDELTLNDLTRDGWKLISVSYNQAYLSRELPDKTFYGKDKK